MLPAWSNAAILRVTAAVIGMEFPDLAAAPHRSGSEIQASESWKSIDLSVDASKCVAPGLTGEEVPGQKTQLSSRHDAGSDGRPESMQHEARGAPREPMLAETQLRLVAVEVDVTAFLAHYPSEQFRQGRVVS